MAFVPVSAPPTYPPSPRTRELAGLLSKVLEEYTKAHPSVTKAEIRAAIRMAQMSAGPDRTRVVAILTITLGLGVAGLFAGLLFQGAPGGESGDPFPMIIAAVIAFLGIVIVAVKLQSR
jgi:hypothetical protein